MSVYVCPYIMCVCLFESVISDRKQNTHVPAIVASYRLFGNTNIHYHIVKLRVHTICDEGTDVVLCFISLCRYRYCTEVFVKCLKAKGSID